jgi:membrane protein
VVFFGLLALFPAITAFVSLYGLFADPSTVSRHLALAAGILPTSALDIMQEQIDRIVQTGETVLGFAFLFGLGLALWSANAGMKAIIDALNVIYGEKEKRSFIKLTLVALAFTAGALVVMLLAVGAVVVVPILFNTFGLGQVSEMAMTILRWPMLLAVVVGGLAILYRFGPSRTQPRWEWLGIGSVVASVIWLTSSVLLSWYLEKFAHYDATYGSLGAGIGMMMWMWISTIAILFGAELNAEIEHQTALDSTVGRPKPLGNRGAAMAIPSAPRRPETRRQASWRCRALSAPIARSRDRGPSAGAARKRREKTARPGGYRFLGTFLPFLRAFDNPIAIACFRLFTLPPFPPFPLLAVPRL